MPLLRKATKTPQELIKSLKDALSVLASANPGSKKADKVKMPSHEGVHVCKSHPQL